MLRITQTIELKLRKKDSSFSIDFLKAFSLAIFLHLVLFLFFRIVSLPNLDRIHPLSPIAVETDLKTDEIVVCPGGQAKPFPMEIPAPSFANLHTIAILEFKKELFPIKKITIDEPDFSKLKIDYHPITDLLKEEEEIY